MSSLLGVAYVLTWRGDLLLNWYLGFRKEEEKNGDEIDVVLPLHVQHTVMAEVFFASMIMGDVAWRKWAEDAQFCTMSWCSGEVDARLY